MMGWSDGATVHLVSRMGNSDLGSAPYNVRPRVVGVVIEQLVQVGNQTKRLTVSEVHIYASLLHLHLMHTLSADVPFLALLACN
jgi:hypothetical protein